MKISFFHDHILRTDGTNYYSLGGLNQEVLHRYTSIFGSINVVCRVRQFSSEENRENFSLSSDKKIAINGIKSIGIFDLLFDTKKSICIKEIVRQSDGIIVRLPSIVGLIAAKEALKINKPIFVEMVADVLSSYWYHSWKGKIIAHYFEKENKKIIKKADYVLYVTSHYLQDKYPTNGKNTDCSDVVLSKTNYSENNRYKHQRVDGNKIIVGTLAAVDVKYKGQSSMIKAIKLLNSSGINVEYQIVGSGDNSYLKKLAKRNKVIDQVRFLGSLKHEEVFDWLKSLDIYIQPSKQEGLPRSVIEAMSVGTFCMGARTGGIPELISDKFIFSKKSSNYKEISEIIKSLTLEIMSDESEKNYLKAKEYENINLHQKRQGFYNEFKNYILRKE